MLLSRGFVYLVAVVHWYRTSCLDGLDRALEHVQHEIVDTGQSAQFIAHAFTDALKAAGNRVNMDDQGRAFGSIFVERL